MCTYSSASDFENLEALVRTSIQANVLMRGARIGEIFPRVGSNLNELKFPLSDSAPAADSFYEENF